MPQLLHLFCQVKHEMMLKKLVFMKEIDNIDVVPSIIMIWGACFVWGWDKGYMVEILWHRRETRR
jgi:hypothetical protein